MTEDTNQILDQLDKLRQQVDKNAQEVAQIRIALFGLPDQGVEGWIAIQMRTNQRLDQIDEKLDTLLDEREQLINQMRGAIIAAILIVVIGLILAGSWEWVWRIVSGVL